MRFGRPAALTTAQMRRARAEHAAGKPIVAITPALDVSRSIIYRALNTRTRGNEPA